MGRTNVIINSGVGKEGIAPGDITGLVVVAKDTKVALKFSDPANTVIDGVTVCTWKGTKLVYKIGSFPTNPDDGVQVLDNTVRNAYASTPFQVTGLTNGTKYYFRLFPYSTEDVINLDGENAFVSTPIEIQPGNVTNVVAKADNGQVTVSWTDPDDISSNGITTCAWAGTELRYKTGGYPTKTTGTLAVNSKTKNQYSETGYTIKGLTNDTIYYFQLFPYSDVGTYNTNTANRITATPVSTRIYGVQRKISSSSTAWERIESGVGKTANATKDGGTVTNDFDSLYPWSDIRTVDISADGTINKQIGDANFSFTNPTGYIMTEVPEFWYKRVQETVQEDGQENIYERIYIADKECEGFTKSNKFYIGRYTATGSSSAVTCKSGAANLVSITLPNMRTAAKNIGTNWGQLDILRWSILQMLYLVEYADYNAQKMLGNGVSSGSIINTGGCDSLAMKSGCLADDKAHAVIYRGIENIFGNIFQWCDGINFTDSQAWICTDPTKYESDKFASPYTKLGWACPSSNGYIKEVGYDANFPALQLTKTTGGSSSTYIPDYSYYYSGSRVLHVGGYFNNDLSCGLWCFSWGSASSSSGSVVGGRLLFTPV